MVFRGDRNMNNRERTEHQIMLWVAGQSVHDDVTDTCCPDYSCCQPERQAPLEEREHYAALCQQGDAWAAARMRLAFLRRTLAEVPELVEV
jgi:hypothetical protein